jgi:hypothetical protein
MYPLRIAGFGVIGRVVGEPRQLNESEAVIDFVVAGPCGSWGGNFLFAGGSRRAVIDRHSQNLSIPG